MCVCSESDKKLMHQVTPCTGLTYEQVDARQKQGLINESSTPATISVGAIIRKNFFTLFNFVNLFLGALVCITGHFANLLFIIVTLLNLVLGCFYEIRSKRILDKLNLMVENQVVVIREGERQSIRSQDIVKDDIVEVERGMQLPADMLLRSGTLFVNEAQLTGETRPIRIHEGDSVSAGSVVVSGRALVQAIGVGKESTLYKIKQKAESYQEKKYELRQGTQRIVRIATAALIPIGILLFISTYLRGANINESILSSVALVVAMIPQGLILLVSSVLSVSAFRLALKNVLVHELYSTETLAKSDLIVFDKTGTLTNGALRVARLVGASRDACAHERSRKAAKKLKDPDLIYALHAIVSAADDAEAAPISVLGAFLKKHYAVKEISKESLQAVPFTHEHMYSGCIAEDGLAFAMGAPQAFNMEPTSHEKTYYELAVVRVQGFDDDGTYQGDPQFLGSVYFTDELRKNIKKTVEYLYHEELGVRIVSGDDAGYCSRVASEVGIKDAQAAINLSQDISDAELVQAARTCVIFGRATPAQKERLIRIWQQDGHPVSMVGDGVNDIMALKAADCSISLGNASPAARTVSDLVLIDNDFAQVPEIFALERRAVNNLSRASSLFLEKNIVSFIIGIICIVLPPYPFIPLQMSLISMLIIGIPSVVLGLEANNERETKRFFRTATRGALPGGISIALGLIFVILLRALIPESTFAQVSLMGFIVYTVVGLQFILMLCWPLNWYRILMFCCIFVIGAVALAVFPAFFGIEALLPVQIIGLCATIAVSSICFYVLYKKLYVQG